MANAAEEPGDIFSQARFDGFDYREHLRGAISFDEESLEKLLIFADGCTIMDRAAVAHCRVMLLLLQHWGDQAFSGALAKVPISVDSNIVTQQITYALPDHDGWEAFPKVGALRRASSPQSLDRAHNTATSSEGSEVILRIASELQEGTIIPETPGLIKSPHENATVNVSRYKPGQIVGCPYSGYWIIVPDPDTPDIPNDGSYEIEDAIPVLGKPGFYKSPYAPAVAPLDLSYFSELWDVEIRCQHTGKIFTIAQFAKGIPVPGSPGMLFSPYTKEKKMIDASGLEPGTKIRDPYSGKVILVP